MAGAIPRARLLLTPVLKLAIAVVGLLILQVLVSALPTVREIPVPSGLPLPVLEIVKVVIATVILVLLVNFAFEIGDNLELAFPAFPQGGAIARWFLLLVAVLIAYGAYRILAETFLRDYAWIYSLVFLGLAIVPLIRMVLLSYRNIDKLLSVAMAGMQTLGAGGGTSRAKGQLQCASCGAALSPGAKFCRGCGAPVPVQDTAEAAPPQCSQCGAALSLSIGSNFLSMGRGFRRPGQALRQTA
jgi:hypothetical protein